MSAFKVIVVQVIFISALTYGQLSTVEAVQDTSPVLHIQPATLIRPPQMARCSGKMPVVADPGFDAKDARVTEKEKTQLARGDKFQAGRMEAMAKAMGGGAESGPGPEEGWVSDHERGDGTEAKRGSGGTYGLQYRDGKESER